MNESKLKAAAMDSVGELPELGNLLLREGGFPHLPSPRFVPAPKADAWNDAGTKPDHPCLCETVLDVANLKSFQYWNGEFFGFACGAKNNAIAEKDNKETSFNVIQWREVQA